MNSSHWEIHDHPTTSKLYNKEVSLAKLEFFSLLRKETRLRPPQGFSQI